MSEFDQEQLQLLKFFTKSFSEQWTANKENGLDFYFNVFNKKTVQNLNLFCNYLEKQTLEIPLLVISFNGLTNNNLEEILDTLLQYDLKINKLSINIENNLDFNFIGFINKFKVKNINLYFNIITKNIINNVIVNDNIKYNLILTSDNFNIQQDNIKKLNNVNLLEDYYSNWTEETIQKYLETLNLYIDNSITSLEGLIDLLYIKESCITCSAKNTLCIDINNFKLVTCSKLAKDKFDYCSFNINDNEIFNIEATNIELMLTLLSLGSSSNYRCGFCEIKDFCKHNCYKSQLDIRQDLMFPVVTICNLFKIRTLFIYYKIINYIKLNTAEKLSDNLIDSLNTFYKNLLKENLSLVSTWKNIIWKF